MGVGVGKNEAFQAKVRQLGTLVGELDAAQGDRGNAAARELVQLLMEVHGTALERMLEIVFDSGALGEAIIQQAGEDPIVRHLLLLYSLHPEDIESRVLKALAEVAPRLRKHSSEAELVSIREGAVQVSVRTSGHACGSTGKTVKALIEESIYDLAPDVASLEIQSPDDEVSSGFVSIESLLKHPLPAHVAAMRSAEVVGAD
jgi:Fe-S cluster biogenesis protein NfuA